MNNKIKNTNNLNKKLNVDSDFLNSDNNILKTIKYHSNIY